MATATAPWTYRCWGSCNNHSAAEHFNRPWRDNGNNTRLASEPAKWGAGHYPPLACRRTNGHNNRGVVLAGVLSYGSVTPGWVAGCFCRATCTPLVLNHSLRTFSAGLPLGV